MFPISFNFPFRKKDGSITTMEDAISSGGGSYTLPTASAETKGGVKIGSGLSMSGETLNNNNPTPYVLPTASAETKGGVKVGSGLSIDENGVLSASGGSGGIILTLIDDTEINGTSNKEISSVDLTNHKGLVIFTKYESNSFLTPHLVKKSSGNLMTTKVVEHDTNTNSYIWASRIVQYSSNTNKLTIVRNDWYQIANDGTITIHGQDSNNNKCNIQGVYYYD